MKIFIKMLHFLHTEKLWCYKMLTPWFIYEIKQLKKACQIYYNIWVQHYKLAFKVGDNRLTIIVQGTGRRKQKGGFALVKCHLKQLLFI